MGWDYPTGGGPALPVSIANGGTGQVTKAAAFDALAPSTTKGDIIGHTGATNARLAVGADTTFVQADSGESTGLGYAAGGGPALPVSIANGGTGQVAKTAAFDALSPLTTKGDVLAHDGSDNVRLAVGADTEVLSALASAASGLDWITGGGGATQTAVIWASLAGTANNTPGQLQIFNVTSSNPGGVLEQTSSGDPGINNGGSNPLVIPKDATIKHACLVFAGAAVSQATTGGAMTARIDAYEPGYSGRTLKHSMDFPVAGAGIFGNASADNFEVVELAGLSLALDQGLLGLQFTDRSANNNEINVLRGIYVGLIIEF